MSSLEVPDPERAIEEPGDEEATSPTTRPTAEAPRDAPAAEAPDAPAARTGALSEALIERDARLAARAKAVALVAMPPLALGVANAGLPFYSTPVAVFIALLLGGLGIGSRRMAGLALALAVAPGLIVHTGLGPGLLIAYVGLAVAGALTLPRDDTVAATFALAVGAGALLFTPAYALVPAVLGALALYRRDHLMTRAGFVILLLVVVHLAASLAAWSAAEGAALAAGVDPAAAPPVPVWGPFTLVDPLFATPSSPGLALDLVGDRVGGVAHVDGFFEHHYVGRFAGPLGVVLLGGALAAGAMARRGLDLLPRAGAFDARNLAGGAAALSGAALWVTLTSLLLSSPTLPFTGEPVGAALGMLWGAVLVVGAAYAGGAYAIERRRAAFLTQREVEEEAAKVEAALSEAEGALSRIRRLLPALDLSDESSRVERAREDLERAARPVAGVGLGEVRARLAAVREIAPQLAQARESALGRFRREVVRVREEMSTFERDLARLGLTDVPLKAPPDSLATLTALDFDGLSDRMAAYRAALLAASGPLGRRTRFVSSFVRDRLSPTFGSASVSFGDDAVDAAPEDAIRSYLHHLALCDERFLATSCEVEAVVVDAARRYVHAFDEVRALLGRDLPEAESALLVHARDHASKVIDLADDKSAYPLRHVYQLEGRVSVEDGGALAFGLVRLRLILAATREAAEERAQSAGTGPLTNPFARLPEIPGWRQGLADEIRILVEEETGRGFVERLRAELGDLDGEVQRISQIIDRQQLDLTYHLVEGTLARALMAHGRVLAADLPVRPSARGEYLRRYAEDHPAEATYDPQKGILQGVAS